MMLLVIGLTRLSAAAPEVLRPPDDPAQSITYWKAHTLSARNDALAARAQAVFEVLLRSWDRSRIAPRLHVVASAAGPWAASLADGNILISRAAIETCLRFGPERAEHLLAFVLAHELAHQGADDLWHQRFFRLIGHQAPEIKREVLDALRTNPIPWEDVRQKEAQADHDALIMMSSVGYDPYQIVDQHDFFTAWVENLWQSPCGLEEEADTACQNAKRRALQTRAQLTNIATQSMLYELGLQAFVAGRYATARGYFSAYGRDVTHRALLTALGLTHFEAARRIQNRLIQDKVLKRPDFYYPFLLEAAAEARPVPPRHAGLEKRSATAEAHQIQGEKMRKHLAQAVDFFEKAIRLEPDAPLSYLYLASTYLLEDNTFMARGILQGKYIPRFGNDAATALMLAMTEALEGKASATDPFKSLIDPETRAIAAAPIPADLIRYSAAFNRAAYQRFLGRAGTKNSWERLARQAQSEGNALLFRLALAHITPNATRAPTLKAAPKVGGLRLGDSLSGPKVRRVPQISEAEISPLWIEGAQYHVYRFKNGARYVVAADGKIQQAWQDAGTARLSNQLAVGDAADRPLKTLGIPDRRLYFTSGAYLAYDRYGLAVHLVDQKVAGWFLYDANQNFPD